MRSNSKHVNFLLQFSRQSPRSYQCCRSFVDDVEIKFVRDRGLDHAVEKERNLKPVINLKNLIKSEPSKSVPLSSITDQKENLEIPIRPIEFVRRYTSIFEEYFPGNVAIHPHIRLTPEVLSLDAEEQLIYESDTFRQQVANRLLKLLMLCRVNEIPLKLIDILKWDLGLPDDYVQTLVPEFPDYFQVKNVNFSSVGSSKVDGSKEGSLELVCWSKELAVPVMEKMARKGASGYENGMPVAFPLKFSNGFEMDKKLKKWLDSWQKLPYISPYENALNLQPNSDESDKWAVGVLHEFLHILVPKKTERDNILLLGEYLGIRSRFKRAMIRHPGIFYISSKIGTYTTVLREGYKRGLLIEKHPLMNMRNKYIHLMNIEKDALKQISVPTAVRHQQVKAVDMEQAEENDGGTEEKDEEKQIPGSDNESDEEDNNGNPKRNLKALSGSRNSRARGLPPRDSKRRNQKKDQRRIVRT